MWKFWKRKCCKIEDLVNVLGHFPDLTKVIEAEPESETKPNPLMELILKTQSLDELEKIKAKYKDSITFVPAMAIMFQEFEIRISALDKRLSEFEKNQKVSS
jgi:hypothetical protein